MGAPQLKEEYYTVEDIYALPEGQRAEIIDGKWYDLASPLRRHQGILGYLFLKIKNYINDKGGNCEVYPAPFAVRLNADDRTYVEPDISVICDPKKLDDQGCVGAPDLVVEITSESTSKRDYGVKLFKYRSSGVREYWIVNPMTETVTVYQFGEDLEDEEKNLGEQYRFDDEISFGLYPDLTVRLRDAE